MFQEDEEETPQTVHGSDSQHNLGRDPTSNASLSNDPAPAVVTAAEESDDEDQGESALSILGDIVKRSKEAINHETDSQKKPDDPVEDTELMQDFEKTMDFLSGNEKQDIQQDPTFVKMRSEYEKIHKLFVQSRKNEKSLMKKCRELTQELGSNASKVLAALKLSQNDRTAIASLKKEAKKAWKLVESTNEKESRSKDAVTSLKMEVESLRTTLAEAGLTSNAPTATGGVGYGRNRLLELQMEQEDQIRHLKTVCS